MKNIVGKYRVKKPWLYDYEITITPYKGDRLMINVENHHFDSHDYAFIKKGAGIDGIYSYSQNAVDFVKYACKEAHVFE